MPGGPGGTSRWDEQGLRMQSPVRRLTVLQSPPPADSCPQGLRLSLGRVQPEDWQRQRAASPNPGPGGQGAVESGPWASARQAVLEVGGHPASPQDQRAWAGPASWNGPLIAGQWE